jgi:hypothetical protein
MKDTTTTIDDLARMINEGFKSTATKSDLTAVQSDMASLRSEMPAGFEPIEYLLLAKQEQRLNELEARMKTLEDALAV